MKRKQRETNRTEPSAATVARLAGISISRVYRLRQEGRKDAEIITASQARKNNLAVRSLPATPLSAANGHAAGEGLTYSAAQAERAAWTAKLKQLDYMERAGELIPLAYVKHWASRFLTEARDLWLRGPSELRDQLASETNPLECEKIVTAFCERVVSRLYELERLWTPPLPPPGMVA